MSSERLPVILTNQKLQLGLCHSREPLESARSDLLRLIMKLVWHASNPRLRVVKTVISQLRLERSIVVTDAST